MAANAAAESAARENERAMKLAPRILAKLTEEHVAIFGVVERAAGVFRNVETGLAVV